MIITLRQRLFTSMGLKRDVGNAPSSPQWLCAGDEGNLGSRIRGFNDHFEGESGQRRALKQPAVHAGGRVKQALGRARNRCEAKDGEVEGPNVAAPEMLLEQLEIRQLKDVLSGPLGAMPTP